MLYIFSVVFFVSIYYFNNKFNNKFNSKFNNFVANILYNLLYWYSVVQIKFTKALNLLFSLQMTFLIEKEKNKDDKELYTFNYIFNSGKIHHTEQNKMSEEIIVRKKDDCPYGLYVILHNDPINLNTTNAILIDPNDLYECNDSEVLNQCNQFEKAKSMILNCEVSNIRFMAIDIKYNNEIYPIFLQKTKNYYIVGNKLNELFFKYYLINELNVCITDNTNFDYKVTILDHNVNVILLEKKDALIIEKDTYILKKSECECEGEKEKEQ